MSKMIMFWEKISGLGEHKSLEYSTFRSVTLISLILLIILVFINLALGMILPALIASVAVVLLVGIFYVALFDRTFNLAILLYTVATYWVVLVSFLFNSGVDGPILYFQLVTFLLLIAVSPKRSHTLILILHGTLSVGLLSVAYFYPSQIHEVYDTAGKRYIDHAVTLVVVLIIIYVLIRNIRNHYARQSVLSRKTAAELHTQQALAHKQNIALESINKMQSRMISILSHDVRSPLNSIAGYLDLLTTGILTEEEQQTTTAKLLELTKQTDIMLVNLLSWSRSQMQGFSPYWETLQVSSLLKDTIGLIKDAAQKKDIRLEVDLENTAFVSDKEMLALVIRNLLNNALKYTYGGGTVALRSWTDRGTYYFEVSDTGTGIPEEMHANLFTEATLSKAGTHTEKGTGLGLVLVHDFVTKLGGTITFQTETGKGTAFTLAFPR